MAVDLGAGAYAAAGGNFRGYRGWRKFDFSKQADEAQQKIDERTQEFQKYMDWELSRNPGLNDEERKELTKNLRAKRMEYINSSVEERAMIMNDLKEYQNQYAQLDVLKKDIANKSQDPNQLENNVGSEFMASPTGQSIAVAMQGSPIENDRKQIGYMIKNDAGEEVFMTVNEINKLVEENTFDNQSSARISGGIVDVNKDNAQKLNPEDKSQNNKYDYDMNYKKASDIVDNGKFKSLVFDEHVGGRTFYNDLQEMLINNTYGDLGIDSEDVNDPTPKTPITEEDAKIIADEMVKNESLTKEYLKTYLANTGEQVWIKNGGALSDETAAPLIQTYLSQRQSSKNVMENTLDKIEQQREKDKGFDNKFAEHRTEMINKYGMDYSKWEDFDFDGKPYHPFTKDDINLGARVARQEKREAEETNDVNTDYA